ncbi:transposon Ty3-G Gag-Pol polyprotein [Nephila pilipes]|uniref:Transposon Ty3-G Gag-Pol polyprotein n=1 Tax=Nephila pilipes TaxID=299642 RepID=A0A8X6QRG3_NEPPI|nr:transposon Ty3-G Gag-Pol polyprotein [Nephila pilipes]
MECKQFLLLLKNLDQLAAVADKINDLTFPPDGINLVAATFNRITAHLELKITQLTQQDEHLDHLHQILSHLRDYGLKLNPDKCVLGKTSVKFLDCLITVAEIAYLQCKSSLANVAILAYPTPDQQLRLFVDASSTANGVALNCSTTNGPKPIAFFSCTLNATETKYSTYDRELLAIYLAIKHFQHQLEGHNFIIFTIAHQLLRLLKSRTRVCPANSGISISYRSLAQYPKCFRI